MSANVDASLATGATISGKVTDAASGVAVSQAFVYLRAYGGGYPAYVAINGTQTDQNGNWSFVGLPTGTYEVQFVPQSPSVYASQYYNDVNGLDPPTPVEATAGSITSNINAALIAGGQISGTVTDGSTHQPAAGVYVTAVDAQGNQYAYATSDANGHYTLSGLSPSSSYRVDFSPAQGFTLAGEFYPSGASLQAAAPVAVTVGQITSNINETLSQGASISGRVTDAATGFPIGSVPVTITDDAGQPVYVATQVNTEPDGIYDVTNLPPGSYKVKFSSEGAAYTDPNGHYEVSGLAPGSYYVEAVVLSGNPFFGNVGAHVGFYGGTSTLAGAKPVTITAGATTAGIDVALAPQAATVAGASVPPVAPTSVTITPTSTPATPPAGQKGDREADRRSAGGDAPLTGLGGHRADQLAGAEGRAPVDGQGRPQADRHAEGDHHGVSGECSVPRALFHRAQPGLRRPLLRGAVRTYSHGTPMPWTLTGARPAAFCGGPPRRARPSARRRPGRADRPPGP